jgi:hypothetical protein
MHHLTSKSADTLSDEFHRLAGESTSKAAREAFLHAAKLLHKARATDFSKRELIPRDPLGLRTNREVRFMPALS